jgi:hypothetical protein
MVETQGLRMGGLALLLGGLGLAMVQVGGLAGAAAFPLLQIFVPAMFFGGGLAGRFPVAALAAGAVAMGVAQVFPAAAPSCWIATQIGVLMGLGWVLDRVLDGVWTRVSGTGPAAFLAGKRGNLLLLAIPLAAVMYVSGGVEGYGDGRPEVIACGLLGYLVAAVYRRRPVLLEAVGERWRVKLIVVLIFAGILALVHFRYTLGPAGLVPMQGWRRRLYCLSYSFLGWRGCYALAGWAGARAGSSGRTGPQ